MQSITSIIHRLKSNYPEFDFVESENFSWSPGEKIIYFKKQSTKEDIPLLIHELSHALLGHSDYKNDMELIKMERDAWQNAKKLAEQYDLVIDDEIIQDNLDSYRDWLHNRSTCTKCKSTGVQIRKNQYECPICLQSWNVNEARIKRLKRTNIK